MSIQLKLNKWYQTRDKRLIKIIAVVDDEHVVDPFTSSDGLSYYPDGRFKRNSDSTCDIVREISHIGILMDVICEEDLVYNITGDKDVGVKATVSGLNGSTFGKRAASFGGTTEAFDVLIDAYQKYIGGDVS